VHGAMIGRGGRLCACDRTRSVRSTHMPPHALQLIHRRPNAADGARVHWAVVCGSVDVDEEESGFCGCAAGRLGSLSRKLGGVAAASAGPRSA
jgi:hypothetical protein